MAKKHTIVGSQMVGDVTPKLKWLFRLWQATDQLNRQKYNWVIIHGTREHCRRLRGAPKYSDGLKGCVHLQSCAQDQEEMEGEPAKYTTPR